MCYNLSFNEDVESIHKYLPGVKAGQLDFDFKPSTYVSGFTYPTSPVVIWENGEMVIKYMQWGYMPAYAKGNVIDKDTNKQRLLNTRTERIIDDPKSIWYRNRDKRVLVPATGDFEHRHISGVKGKKTVPYYIQLKERRYFFLLGLWTKSKIPDASGNYPDTFSISIRNANPIMRAIHNGGDNPYRMPLVTPPTLESSWLNPDLSDQQMKLIFDYEISSEELEYWSVKSLYKADRYDKTILDPVTYEGEPPLEAA